MNGLLFNFKQAIQILKSLICAKTDFKITAYCIFFDPFRSRQLVRRGVNKISVWCFVRFV